MSTVQQELSTTNGMSTVAPAQHYSTFVKIIKTVGKEASNMTPTSVEIFSNGSQWYCQVRRGNKTTKPMGPYSKLQAERIQDARRMLIAKRGTANLVFE
ncbi:MULTISPECIES: hypothetical protein [unclassified Mesorhizobium]|uniref:hypothetical protein n=1 Tax=unclassified Mesorhizobium TaxID=325217 RepID=UPI0007EC9A4F|nr:MULTISPECIES: hypothetical protein [unclassified Mesorhizobium]RUZ92011.1 hypothetical protein EN947_02315 [Mesorhizobium sp. M7A.F.Ca.US.003.02.2.1]ARP65592.1 hypothetical protein A9K65_021220 [Mesorhizobium sp. WSM1497]MBZ9889119.1 hypothetical protein [Mesorhizobium sp. BR1-1-3]RUX76639.1 hypothetical protein EN990_08650 [Mesorhizobium sp. M7A.F.Ca.US.005.03.1.1]RUY12480.1 hypothetical protein EN991_23385 [Mesorhizobium sp. M7A.F.Ca.US.005.03.2.1]